MNESHNIALQQMLGLYTHILDYGDIENMDWIWAEDCVFQVDVPAFRVQGLSAVKQLLRETRAGYPQVRHIVTNCYVDWSGSTPVLHSYLQIFDSARLQVTMFARYRDRCVETAKGWRIAERICING